MTEFVPMLSAPIFEAREQLAGGNDYLPAGYREDLNRQFIQEIEAKGRKMPKYDVWYLRYYKEPYMETFSREQFVSRWADIWDNLIEVTPELKIAPAPPDTKPRWMTALVSC